MALSLRLTFEKRFKKTATTPAAPTAQLNPPWPRSMWGSLSPY